MTTGQVTTRRVVDALRANGYTSTGITRARFLRINDSGQEVHEIGFTNEDTGEPDTGHVYVWTDGDRVLADF